jgi:DNA-binding NarL/FixJ family response regulator
MGEQLGTARRLEPDIADRVNSLRSATARIVGEERTGANALRTEKRKPRVALIDPKPLTREALAILFATHTKEFSVKSFSSIEELLAESSDNGNYTELILLNIADHTLDEDPARTTMECLSAHARNIPLIIISHRSELAAVTTALMRGIRGYIPTSLETGVVVEALRLVHAGGTFVPANALTSAAGRAGDAQTETSVDTSGAVVVGMTPRQMDVLRLLCKGRPNKLIASELHMVESTVKVHVRHIMRKLKARNRTELALIASHLLQNPYAPKNETGVGQ